MVGDTSINSSYLDGCRMCVSIGNQQNSIARSKKRQRTDRLTARSENAQLNATGIERTHDIVGAVIMTRRAPQSRYR